MKEITVEADKNKLSDVLSFVDEQLEEADCPMKAQMQIDVVIEEIFVNIASYAYAPGTGSASVFTDVSGNPGSATIIFRDTGVPYNPLEKEDPDITLSADERQIGGLGIFMTKKLMDEVSYEYENGENVLRLVKRF